ncbi:DNA topoisomerase 3 [Neobacillus sp. YIM B02564]|uniref:DNA topoisomerase n=1 Tax=Neobacillus paridis TaxID=2803862 RepID=A0ABS1TQF4_9BACI|nr:type IA DNA topoisomerase [Neobacillus paridis]MBL4952110.1 DNA topoisomerase 3 [Neobacillus paridis]
MSQIVVLCEKPDQAITVAAAFGDVQLSNGEFLKTKHLSNPKYERLIREARKEGFLKGNMHLYTYAYGHLTALKEPHEIEPELKSWKMDTLPFFFDYIPLKVIYGMKGLTKKQFQTVKSLFNDINTEKIIVSTDSEREGEHIFRTIYQLSGCKKPFERMWIRDFTEEGILKAYNTRKDGHAYDGLADAAKCRAESDYLVGLNMTRAMTIKFGGFKNVLSIGRVQTPTLAILVKREQEIRNFKPEDYFVLKTIFKHPNGEFEGTWFKGKETKFSNEMDARAVLQKVKDKNGILTEVDVSEKREVQPLLFNLSELQRIMSKTHGFSVSKTLELAQNLYDKHKLITYPRTSSRYIATGTGKTTKVRLQNLTGSFPFAGKALKEGWSIASYMVNDAKTTDHEALIPTNKAPDLSTLSKEELAVYETIVKRFVAAFYPVCIWEETKAVTTVEGETFKSSGKVLKQAGWREVEGIPNAQMLPALSQHDSVSQKKMDVEKKKTTPPSRFTDGELIAAMKNVGNLVEDDALKATLKESEGIGTEATRASIIEELIKRGYVKREKKMLVPTDEKGMALFNVLPVETLKSPEMTAVWEQKLSLIEEGKLTRKAFMTELKNELAQMVAEVLGSAAQKLGTAKKEQTVICKCPSCGGNIVENTKAYSCANWKQGCKETIWKNSLEKLGKKSISALQAKQLFEKKKTTRKVKLKSTKGKTFEAYLVYKNSKIELEF